MVLFDRVFRIYLRLQIVINMIAAPVIFVFLCVIASSYVSYVFLVKTLHMPHFNLLWLFFQKWTIPSTLLVRAAVHLKLTWVNISKIVHLS